MSDDADVSSASPTAEQADVVDLVEAVTADDDPATEHGEGSADDGDGSADAVAAGQAAIDDARRRVAEAPAEVVVTNHVMGLYELAAIHLSAERPDLPSAALAIDAVACLVDGLGDRLGPDATTLRDALANVRLAFVEIKRRQASDAPSGPG